MRGIKGIMGSVVGIALAFAACGDDNTSNRPDVDPAGSGFVSDGTSAGVTSSVVLNRDESFAGLMDDIEVAIHLRDAQTFEGRVRNEAVGPVCDLSVTVVADGVPIPSFQTAGLTRSERASFTIPVTVTFAAWEIDIEHFGCASAPPASAVASSEGREGGDGGSEGGGEGGSESEGGDGDTGHTEGSDPEFGGGEGGGGESASESNPNTPLTQRVEGTFLQQDYAFGFDTTAGVFRGTVINPGPNVVCRSRTEIHLNVGGNVIELGPTIPVDLQPGDMLSIVMSATGQTVTAYSLHPESSPCPQVP